jgi:hypothetical protein
VSIDEPWDETDPAIDQNVFRASLARMEDEDRNPRKDLENSAAVAIFEIGLQETGSPL